MLFQAAHMEVDLTLTSFQARELALIFSRLDSMLDAYFNEYGKELASELLGIPNPDETEAEIVEEDTPSEGETESEDGATTEEE